jgi:hypothetical protein
MMVDKRILVLINVLCLIYLIGNADAFFFDPTPYQPRGPGGGYSETQISENVWQVYFEGNAITTDERASDYLLLRSAEIAKHNGFDYFEAIDSKSKPVKKSFNLGKKINKNKTDNPQKSCIVICFKEKPETGTVYNAEFVIKSIKQKYGLQ